MRKGKLTPVRIATIYILFGALWILFSDAALHALVHDADLENRLQTAKGWLYVFVTGGLVFALARQMGKALETEDEERRRAEAAMHQALTEAERASQAKTEFLAAMSHEFRTPLNAILGFSDLIRAQYHGPVGADIYREYADDIHRSGAMMLALVNDLLDVSEIEAGKRHLRLEALDLGSLLPGCLKTFGPQAAERRVSLKLDLPAPAPDLWGDHLGVIQVVSNLVSNAVKYTLADGEVVLSAATTADGTAISVRDTGIGIAAALIPAITEPFSRAPADPHVTREGKGLGLAIVKSLVDAHGGVLEIDSVLGVGTRVTVHFPARDTAG